MTVMRQMPSYQCHKIVWALQIKEIKSDVMPTSLPGGSWSLYPVEVGFAPIEVSHDWFVKHKPEEGGYFVEYEDGYKSFSPQAAFESGYAPLSGKRLFAPTNASLECCDAAQADVLSAVVGERSYQNNKCGTVQDRPHEVGGYLTLMRVHLAEAEAHWAYSNGDQKALDELRKVVAIGVACFEQHGVPSRSASIPVGSGANES